MKLSDKIRWSGNDSLTHFKITPHYHHEISNLPLSYHHYLSFNSIESLNSSRSLLRCRRREKKNSIHEHHPFFINQSSLIIFIFSHHYHPLPLIIIIIIILLYYCKIIGVLILTISFNSLTFIHFSFVSSFLFSLIQFNSN